MTASKGTAMRRPGLILGYFMDPAVSINQPEGTLVQILTTADDTVTLPSGTQPTAPLMGLLYEVGPAVLGGLVQVVVSGVFPGIAQGTMTPLDEVTAYSTAGAVQSVTGLASGTNAGVVGQCLEAAVTGQRVGIFLNQYVKQG